MHTTQTAALPRFAPRRGPAPARTRRAAEPKPAVRTLEAADLGEHLDRLMRAALAMTGSRPDAEDLVQEVCVRVLSKPRAIRGDAIAYLLGVLRNTFIDGRRAQARRQTVPVEPVTLEQVPGARHGDPELGAQAAEVHRAIAALAPHYRDTVVAVDVLGLPYADAAATLGVPAGTIMSRLHRGRAAVAEAVGTA